MFAIDGESVIGSFGMRESRQETLGVHSRHTRCRPVLVWTAPAVLAGLG